MSFDLHFIFINPPGDLCDEWRKAIAETLPKELYGNFTVVEGYLDEVPAKQLDCDCVVSPANSYGIMDGGYDAALSRYFPGQLPGGGVTVSALTRAAQSALQARWRGYAPPGSATITLMPADIRNPVGATTLAIVPTMRIPEDVAWHRDLVYNSMWSLLCEIANWNAVCNPEKRIKSALTTGLGTGTGNVSAQVAAKQMILAVKHFIQGVPLNGKWPDVYTFGDEVEATYAEEVE